MSTRIVRGTHGELLPASSKTRVCRVCSPSPATGTLVPGGPLWSPPASSRHSTWSTPESASVPVTSTFAGTLRQAVVPEKVVSPGAVRSIRTVSARQPESLPSASTARVSKVCSPSAAITALPSPSGGLIVAPPSTVHSMRSNRVSSVPESSTT